MQYDDMSKEQLEDRYRAAAREAYPDGEVPAAAVVELAVPGGAWVGMWMWISREEVEDCGLCGGDPSGTGRWVEDGMVLCGDCADRVSEQMDARRVSRRRAIAELRRAGWRGVSAPEEPATRTKEFGGET